MTSDDLRTSGPARPAGPSTLDGLRAMADGAIAKIATNAEIGRVADAVAAKVRKFIPPGAAADALHGVWLGHPLHPMLTDLPIGCWTSAMAVDHLTGPRGDDAADLLVALGIASAVPTAASGLADWSHSLTSQRRVGLVHAAANTVGLACYAASLWKRRRGRRGSGIALSWVGAGALTVGGYLGGHLAYRQGVGVDHTLSGPDLPDWTPLGPVTPGDNGLSRAEVDGGDLVMIDTPVGRRALADRCSHLGGPLHEGDVVDGCVRCPWHGSRFRPADGSVARGPATAPQPAYDLREPAAGEPWEARRRSEKSP